MCNKISSEITSQKELAQFQCVSCSKTGFKKAICLSSLSSENLPGTEDSIIIILEVLKVNSSTEGVLHSSL